MRLNRWTKYIIKINSFKTNIIMFCIIVIYILSCEFLPYDFMNTIYYRNISLSTVCYLLISHLLVD